MRYVNVRRKKKSEDEAYRIYVTDALYALVNGGQTMTKRFFEILYPVQEQEQEQETKGPEEIKSKIVDGLRRLSA